MTNKKHNYDWDAMDFDPDDGDVASTFLWYKTPQGVDWWGINAYTPEGQAEFARMNRLYAEDMAAKKGPVRTVTRKEIVPGVYGKVTVHCAHGCGVDLSFPSNDLVWDASELRSAAETLIQIADALEA